MTEEYERYLRDRGLAPRTIEEYLLDLRTLESRYGIPPIRWESDQMRLLRDDVYYAPASRGRMMCSVRSFLRWAADEGIISLNGQMRVVGPVVPDEEPAPMSRQTALRLLGGCRSPSEYRMVYLGLYAGLRISEAARVDRIAGGRFIIFGKGRGGMSKRRRVPVHPEIIKVWDIIASKQPSSKATLFSAFSRMRARLGDIQDVDGERATTHTLRATFASVLYEQGTPWERISKLLGHKLPTTGKYVLIHDDYLEKDVKPLTYRLPEPPRPVQMQMF